MKIIAVPSN